MWDTIIHLLQQPLDSSRPHHIDIHVAWHGRIMVLAWGVCIPIGIILARFYKITPKQDFPHYLDNQFWWYGHLLLQIMGSILAVASLIYVLVLSKNHQAPLHETMGWITMVGLGVQIGLGICRGRKGGPTDTTLFGDHYNMTTYRYIFEYCHKYLGYVVVILSWITGATGMWYVNAPVWIWLILGMWLCILIWIFAYLQYRGYAVDTYEAIWGLDCKHPGNEKRIVPIGVRRLRLEQQGKIGKKKRHIQILGRYNTKDY